MKGAQSTDFCSHVVSQGKKLSKTKYLSEVQLPEKCYFIILTVSSLVKSSVPNRRYLHYITVVVRLTWHESDCFLFLGQQSPQ